MACNALSCLKQDGLTLMAEQAQASSSCLREGTCLSGSQRGMASLSAIYQLLPFLMDYKLGRTKAPPVDKSVVLVNCLSPCISHHETHD